MPWRGEAVVEWRAEMGPGGGARPGAASALYALAACLAFGFLYLLSRYSYLLFHGIAEVFSVLIAWSIFIIAWNTRRTAVNGYLLFLGIAYLFVGGIDIVHTLAYKGMGVFQGYQTNLPTQLWISARYLESLSLLVSPFFLRRRLKPAYAFAAYAAISAFIYLTIFVWDVFPTCFVEGAGLTTFKKASEYAICGILLGALAYLYRERERLERRVLLMFSASILITAASELSFTLYVDPYGLFNQLGHFLKIVSFYLIYRAVVVTSLTEPYNLLYRELKQSEERFRGIVESAPFGYYRLGRDGLWEYVNPVWERMHGLRLEEVVGKPFEMTLPPGETEAARRNVQLALSGETVTGEFSHLTGGGEMEYHILNIRPVWRGGEVVAVEGFINDITELVNAERALRESEERYRVLAENLPQVVFELDAEGKVIYMNRTGLEMFGFTEEEISVGMNALRFIDPSDHARITRAIGKIMSGASEGDTKEYLARKKDGSTFPCVVYSAAIMDEGGRPVGLRGILADISERKRMEEEIIRANRELELYAEVVSHDLRGPVSVIRSAAESMESLMEGCGDPKTAETAKRTLEIMRNSSEAAQELIEDLLALAKAGQMPERIIPVRVGEVVERVLRERVPGLESKGMRVERDEDLGTVMADPTHIYQIFSNLIANAIAYNDSPRPELSIAYREEGSLHRYLVKDNGSGILQGEAEDIFLPLHRGKGGGTGLGLSIVHRLVTLYGGTIRAYNDGGACFEFTLRDYEAGLRRGEAEGD